MYQSWYNFRGLLRSRQNPVHVSRTPPEGTCWTSRIQLRGGAGKLYQDWYKAGYTRIGTSSCTTGAGGLASPAPPSRVPGAGTCWMSRIRLRGRAGKLYQDWYKAGYTRIGTRRADPGDVLGPNTPDPGTCDGPRSRDPEACTNHGIIFPGTGGHAGANCKSLLPRRGPAGASGTGIRAVLYNYQALTFLQC